MSLSFKNTSNHITTKENTKETYLIVDRIEEKNMTEVKNEVLKLDIS